MSSANETSNASGRMDNERKSPLVLRFEDIRSARAFKEGESFWETHIDHMIRLLKAHEERLQNPRNGDGGPYIAFAILGGRGSGKSSLLKTFLDRLRENGEKDKVRVHELPSLDPTILSKHDNFLHAFVAALLEQLEGQAEERRMSLHELKCRSSLQQMSDHLWVVNGGPPKEEDRVAAGLERLDRHRSGPLLQKRLGLFLDDVAQDFGNLTEGGNSARGGRKRILLLPVDDPDMAFEQFTSILEIYRRYLRHPYLVPVFAFSRELAHELLTLQFGEQLGFGERRIPDDDRIRSKVERLANHFLDKLLPPSCRVVLDLPQKRLLDAFYESAVGNGEVSGLLERAAKQMFGRREQDLRGFDQRLLPGSLRRQLQLLEALARLEIVPSEAFPKTPDRESTEANFEQVANAMLQVHASILQESGIDLEGLQSTALDQRASALLDQVLRRARQHGLPLWEHRRSESLLLSLLAARILQPMRRHDRSATEKDTNNGVHQSLSTMRVTDFLEWLLGLQYGFYLPLRLAQAPSDKKTGSPGSRSDTVSQEQKQVNVSSLTMIGQRRWDLRTTARGVLEVAGRQPAGGFPGVFFLHPGGTVRYRASKASGEIATFAPGSFAVPPFLEAWGNRGYGCFRWLQACDGLRKRHAQVRIEPFPGLAGLINMAGDELELLLRIWCSYGSRPRPWVALSLWRGLGLLARVVAARGETGGGSSEDTIRGVIEEHLTAGSIAASLPWPKGDDTGPSDTAVPAWSARLSEATIKLTDALAEWLRTIANSETGTPTGCIELKDVVDRLHGAALDGELMATLGGLTTQLSVTDWGAGTVLEHWLRTFLAYWSSTRGAGIDLTGKHGEAESKAKVCDALRACPLLRLFGLGKLPQRSEAAVGEVSRFDSEDWWSALELTAPIDDPTVGTQIRKTSVEGLTAPREILNILVPADYETFFEPIRIELESYRATPTELL